MAKEILLGPLLGSNRSSLIRRCSELVSEGKSETFLYITASHPLLELVTDQILEQAKTPGLWGDLPVYLFRGLVRKVLSSAVEEQSGAVITPRVPIDREELPLKRGLISQILRQLASTGQLTAIKPLANREGCVNSVATLIGEIERAAKTPEEFAQIVSTRVADLGDAPKNRTTPHPQISFDKDVALIYSTYSAILAQNNFTEADADQLRALAVLQGQLDGHAVRLPWLDKVELLVLDGFFDFTPVQGEMLRQLILRVPEVTVNLNYDVRNTAIFEPFSTTLDQLKAIAEFDEQRSTDAATVDGALSGLRENLFKASESPAPAETAETQDNIRLFTCADRETEIRKVAKEIKRLVVEENYRLADIALIVRERASYADTIARVMRDEAVPCDLERRINVSDIPSVRAARKLFEMLETISQVDKPEVRVCDLADLIKSEYFRIADTELEQLDQTFEQSFGALLTVDEDANGSEDADGRRNLKRGLGIGYWSPDSLENTIAFVGSTLSITGWLERARKLFGNWPQVTATTDLVSAEPAEGAADEETDQIEDADKVATDDRGVEKKRRPSRDVHPATLAWTAMVLDHLSNIVKAVPREGSPTQLRLSLMGLLERLQLSTQIRRPLTSRRAEGLEDRELPYVMLDVRGLEALRRALVTAVKSVEATSHLYATTGDTRLTSVLNEVQRALDVEVSLGRTAERGGLRVLEATDVRGLHFRAIFIAGLVEGGFPLRASRDWIYPHEERERLKRDYQLTLEDISPATLLKEEHYFYQAACRATERLYLSRPLLLDDGTETVASYYINELARAIQPFALENIPVRRDFDGAEIFDASTANELTVSLVRQDERQRHRAGRAGLLAAPLVSKLNLRAFDAGYLSADTLRRVDIERDRASDRFTAYDGQITSPQMLSMLQRRFDADYVHSASGLSTYGNCSYRFFANRILRLEPRGEAALDLQAIDAGKLLHDVLRRFFERHRGERLNDHNRDSLRAELRAVAEQVFKEHEHAVPPLNPDIWKIDCEIRKIILDQVLLYELTVQKQTKADVRSTYFEVAFGMRPRQAADPQSTIQQLELTRSTSDGEDTIRIQGQIDRVDQAADGTLVAYDYKLSTGANAEDMKAGRSLQLPIYLEALERLLLPGQALAGGGYYILKPKGGRRNSGMYRKEFGQYLGLHPNNSILTDYDWTQLRSEVVQKIWEFFDGMRSGDFRVRPSLGYTTCKFCDYKAVCRYEKYRIRWKERLKSEK
ncbi:MAG TPA: PD-(D/E)XK nuclease family protein [Pyrinomonadaceae bacterium]